MDSMKCLLNGWQYIMSLLTLVLAVILVLSVLVLHAHYTSRHALLDCRFWEQLETANSVIRAIEDGADTSVRTGDNVTIKDAFDVLLKKARTVWLLRVVLEPFNENFLYQMLDWLARGSLTTLEEEGTARVKSPAGAEHKKTFLHMAAECSEHQEAVEMAIAIAHEDSENHRTSLKRTPLHFAAKNNGNPGVVKLFMESGAVNAVDADNDTPLHFSARNNENPEVVKLLLDRGADVNARGKDKRTPLHGAAQNNNNREIIALLLDRGADVHAVDANESSSLHLAVKWGGANPEVVRLLLSKGADLEATDKYGRTPLHDATEFGTPDVVRPLLDAGASLAIEDEQSRTPLHGAVAAPEMVELLLAKDAKVDVRDKEGRTPLHEATGRRRANLKVVELLLRAGADLHAVDKYKNTPLHEAVRWDENLRLVELLLENGADHLARNTGEVTPKRMAAQAENLKLVRYFLEVEKKK